MMIKANLMVAVLMSGVAGIIPAALADGQRGEKLLESRVLSPSSSDEQWAAFMKDNDLVWDEVSPDFYNGAYIGDGFQGAMVMGDDQDPDCLRMLMGRYDLIAHYQIPDFEYCIPKLFAGSIIVDPKGSVEQRSMRMDLWNGMATGEIKSDKGSLTWSSFVERTHGVFMVELNSTSGEKDASVYVRPEWGISPKLYLENVDPQKYIEYLPPKPTSEMEDGEHVVIQKLMVKGAHAVVSKLIEDDGRTILFAALGTSDLDDRDQAAVAAVEEARTRLHGALDDGFAQCRNRHLQWWHSYMKKSYVALGQDAYWQKNWWIQVYKFGSASSEDSAFLIDNQGPWTWNCGWGAIWWNWNVQAAYSPAFSANRLEAGHSMINGINRLYDSGRLHRNSVSGVGITIGRASTYEGESTNEWAKEYGNITWVLHNYWRFWRFSGDDELGRKMFPMLADSVDFLMTKLELKNDGRLHMVASRSPEYNPEDPFHTDTNYSLMTLRWALMTLVEMNDEFSFKDERLAKWEETLGSLVDYPVDENGFMVSAKQGYVWGHRHFSHLKAIYPYHTVTIEQGDESRELIKTSVDTWMNSEDGLFAWSYAIGSAMYSTMGDGEKAISTLDKMRESLTPNAMYYEGGGPCLETAMAAVETTTYMLLQSWGDTIRVFPAVPERWLDASFNDLRAEGAFLVSGVREDGANKVVRIKSLKGKPLKVMPGLGCADSEVQFEGVGPERVELLGNGLFEVDLKEGESIYFISR